jgi:predicted secreted hydrolase
MRRRHALVALSALAGLRDAHALVPRALAFPRDHGAHPETRIEWWYVTGALQTDDSTLFGWQITFFRVRTGVRADHPSAFAATQLLFAHAAVTDVAAQRLRHAQQIARAGFGIAATARDDLRVTLRGWSMARAADDTLRVVAADADAGFAFDLALRPTQPLLLQGDAGWSRKGPGAAQASQYVSWPQLDTSGTLRLDGRARAVRGRAWLDHEWSDELLDREAVGWDWCGMNLDDGGALTAFRLRRREGSALWAGGSHRAADGTLRVFGADEVRFAAGRTWASPGTGARYPVEWRLDTPAGAFALRALLDAQELDTRGSAGTAYWEGLSELLDANGARIGRGYLEMTGYAGRLRL